MQDKLKTCLIKVKEIFGIKIQSISLAFNEITIVVTENNYLYVLKTLRDHPEFKFTQLIDLCGVDYLHYETTEALLIKKTSAKVVKQNRGSTGQEENNAVNKGAALSKGYSNRYAVVLHLLSLSYNTRLRVRVFVPSENFPVLPSIIEIWSCANWYEREAFDLFGIIFDGHQDLRRLLTDYGFIGHPFRKDFPISGNVEVCYDPKQGRVIYQPVTIEPREVTPRIVREPQYGAN